GHGCPTSRPSWAPPGRGIPGIPTGSTASPLLDLIARKIIMFNTLRVIPGRVGDGRPALVSSTAHREGGTPDRRHRAVRPQEAARARPPDGPALPAGRPVAVDHHHHRAFHRHAAR